ncbi:MAG: hypothetical protein ACOZB1_10515, partial [Pseudomonadota bacterium]
QRRDCGKFVARHVVAHQRPDAQRFDFRAALRWYDVLQVAFQQGIERGRFRARPVAPCSTIPKLSPILENILERRVVERFDLPFGTQESEVRIRSHRPIHPSGPTKRRP